MCMYSNSRNDVPRVAQRYGTIAAHTRRRATVFVVFVVLCMHMYSFAGLIKWMPPPTFSDTAITDRHSDTSSELTGSGYPDLLDRKNRSDMCPRLASNPRLPACKASTLCTRPCSPLVLWLHKKLRFIQTHDIQAASRTPLSHNTCLAQRKWNTRVRKIKVFPAYANKFQLCCE